MIDLYYWTTPNGNKILLFLEEAGLEYTIHPVNISKGDQFTPDFLAIAPNNKIPALVDHGPEDRGAPVSIFESGAILTYLAEKTSLFLPQSLRERVKTLEWLHWQMGGLGPIAGQNHHFGTYALEKIPYAIDRFTTETARLYRVLNTQLEGRSYIVGDSYTIADMACHPWIASYERQKQDLNDFPHIKTWFERVLHHPGAQRAYEIAKSVNTTPTVSDSEARKILFGQK